ncbi:hypothetical protein HYV89_02740 [Candidatus Woesearchaeota archaeon]|nr:hypothetical protein [Candidatus Woesearchaeota archaeon]
MSQKETSSSTVRIDKKLLSEIKNWLKDNGNKYKHSSVSAFVNSAIYEKLKRLR